MAPASSVRQPEPFIHFIHERGIRLAPIPPILTHGAHAEHLIAGGDIESRFSTEAAHKPWRPIVPGTPVGLVDDLRALFRTLR